MTPSDLVFPDLANELAVTRTVLDRLPDAHFGWTPHEKSAIDDSWRVPLHTQRSLRTELLRPPPPWPSPGTARPLASRR